MLADAPAADAPAEEAPVLTDAEPCVEKQDCNSTYAREVAPDDE